MSARILNFLIIILLPAANLEAQTIRQLKQMVNDDSLRLVEIFKDIHQNPELGFMEVRTAAIVAKELKALGYDVTTGIGKTGVVGVLKNGDGPVVLYRADMDCNSVKEITGVLYASNKTVKKEDGTEVPVMHACGHDAHITWMLGIAKIMVTLKKEWKGTLILLAQPAEEILQGAQAMVTDSMYEKGIPVPDYLLALHTWPFAVGTVINGTGERSAGSDQLDVIFHGVGGHGSAPDGAKDPIVMASMAVIQYQTIVSRNVPPQDVAVVTVSAIHSGTDYNIIPASASIKLNLRWFSDKTRNIILDGIKRINEGLAIANNLPKDLYPEIKMKGNAYPLLNDTTLTNKINANLAKMITPENIITNIAPIMGSEDFPLFARRNKKAVYDYLFVGIAGKEVMAKAAAEGKKYPFYHHTANYEVDLSAIPLGTVIGATSLLEIFKK
ncbi:MAG: amidohydrolase [Ginsengibacter sp.]